MKTFATILIALIATVSSFASNGIVRNDNPKNIATVQTANTLSVEMTNVLDAVILGCALETSTTNGTHLVVTTNDEIIVTNTFATHQFSDNKTSDTIQPIIATEIIFLDAEEL
jgi:hypothetical protein